MIPRPSVRINPFEEQELERFSSDIDDRTVPATDLIPPADYPMEEFSPSHDRARSDAVGTTPAYYDYYSPYSAVIPVPQYRYVTYHQPTVIPRSGPLYDPYYYGPLGYDYYPASPSQNIYRIPPGTRFDMIHYDSQVDRERFEVESVTGQGVPHHVRKTTTGERFVVEPPVTNRSDADRGVIAPSSRHRRAPGRTRDRNVVSLHEPKFRHVPPRDSAGSTSSYTEASIQTRSGPHFMNGVDYLDVSTRSRILTWLNKSSDRPIRLRPVNIEHIDSQTGEPLRFRTNQQGNH